MSSVVVGGKDPAVLGLNVSCSIIDEANFMAKSKPLAPNTPVQHQCLPGMVGVVKDSWDDGKYHWYTVDWIQGHEGREFAVQMRDDWLYPLPSAMHLLGSL